VRALARISGANSPLGHAIEFAGCFAGAASQFMRMGGPVPAGERLLIQTPAFLYCIGEE
jgi:hypothetical protein